MSYFNKKAFTMRQVVGLFLTIVFLGIRNAIAYAAKHTKHLQFRANTSSSAVNQNFQALADAINTGDVACPSSMVRSGSVWLDKYEASVWETTNAALIVKIKAGTATRRTTGQMQPVAWSKGAVMIMALGVLTLPMVAARIFMLCPFRSNAFKVYLHVFQVAAAARNSGKRLPSKSGVAGSSPLARQIWLLGIVSAGGHGVTGTAGCVSDVGAYDMACNLGEWVADWVPASTQHVPSWEV